MMTTPGNSAGAFLPSKPKVQQITTACMVYAIYPVDIGDYETGVHHSTTYVRAKSPPDSPDDAEACCCLLA